MGIVAGSINAATLTKEYQDQLALAFDEEGRGYDDSCPNEENANIISGNRIGKNNSISVDKITAYIVKDDKEEA